MLCISVRYRPHAKHVALDIKLRLFLDKAHCVTCWTHIMKCIFLLVVSFASVSVGFLGWGEPAWNGLRVTFGLSPDAMPRTVDEAKKKGWTLDKACDVSNGFYGNRYILKGDTGVMLLYDDAGYIAGIQTGVAKNQRNGFPAGGIMKETFLAEANMNTVTAYFTPTDKICNGGRTKAEYDDQGTGTMLLIQNGGDPKNLITIPMDEKRDDTKGTLGVTKPWTKGRCFVGMGQHYWYNLSKNMDCDDSKPLFLLYNKGKLNAFGWALFADLPSSRYEHPPSATFSSFISEVPDCLYNAGTISTMHIYLTDSPFLNFC